MDSNSMFGDVSFDIFEPVIPSFTGESMSNRSGGIYSQEFLMAGVVVEVYPPSSKFNRSKSQYEYLVSGVGKLNSYKPMHCVTRDGIGGVNDFEIFTLKQGQRVLVECLLGSPESGVIVGGLKNQAKATDETLGHHWMRRFNKITNSITKEDTYYVKHDDGNEIRVEKDQIVVRDGDGESLVIDKKNKKITISDNKGESITIDRSSNKIIIECKDMSMEVKGNLKVNVKGNADIKADKINLNKAAGDVVTTATWPVDLVTGVPFKGVRNVKA